MAIELTAGWTEEITYTLSDDGTAVNLSGCTVTIQAKDATGAALTFTGSVAVTDEANGVVAFSPGANDIATTGQPFYIRFKVVASDDDVSYFPSADAEKWTIRS